jgi:chemotaxis protein methyltransferase CheR
MEIEISNEVLSRASAFVASTIGLYFAPERWPDLVRGIAAAALDLGFHNDANPCLRWLAGAPALTKTQLETLAAHLTVGETYFFREKRHFDLLAEHIVPELLHSKGTRPLKIWSAGCCTGEEAYSIAIILRRLLPGLKRGQITVLATDINSHFLGKAETGIYGPWSFRDAPAWLKSQYFRAQPDGRCEVLPEIREMVRFAPLNLADDAYPSLLNEIHSMDVVFCRNVLMYFSPEQARRVLEKLHRAQAEGGWLIVASSELPHVAASPYATVRASGVLALRKLSVPGAESPLPSHRVPAANAPGIEANDARETSAPDPRARAAELCAGGFQEQAAALLDKSCSTVPFEKADGVILCLLARYFANQGQLTEALRWCDRSIAADKCSAASQYLRGLILKEQGETDAAIHALRATLFLDPEFVLAYVALGTLARDKGQTDLAQKHLQHAMELMEGIPPDALVSEIDEITAGELMHMVHASIHEGMTP